MPTKEPVVLVVLVDAARLRWFVAAINLDGSGAPLLRSEDGDLATYQGLSFDDQVSFLRHRFCGILQRGCDRLWPVGKRAGQFAVLFQGPLPGATEELLPRVAEHFAEWMLNPPVVVLTCEGVGGPPTPQLRRLAGTIDAPFADLLANHLPGLLAAAADPDAWEVSSRKGTWRPPADDDPSR
jgi:hypothetical protein